MQTGANAVCQAVGRRNRNLMLNKKIQAAIKDEPELQMHPCHRCDFNGQGALGALIERHKTVKTQNE